MRAPTLYRLRVLHARLSDGSWPEAGVKAFGRTVWVPCRPEGYYSLRERLRIAWGVFTGRYDAIQWHEDELADEERRQREEGR